MYDRCLSSRHVGSPVSAPRRARAHLPQHPRGTSFPPAARTWRADLARAIKGVLCAALLVLHSPITHATPLTVTHFGDGMYGVPFAVALEKGYFKQAGIDVTGFITSEGGGTTVRNAMASDIPYGEVSLSAAVAAIKQGINLTIVHSGVQSLADLVWVQVPNGTLSQFSQMKGKTLGYSSPKSTTDMVSTIALERAGMTDSVKRRPVGNSSSMIIALQQGAVDAAYINEPTFSAKKDVVKLAFRSLDIVPNETQTVGVVRTDYLKAHPEVVRGIIEARRKGVAFILGHRAEAGEILAKQYKLDPAVTTLAINNVLNADPHYWSEGSFDYPSMDEVLKGLILVKALPPGDFAWSKVVDESLLPKNLQSAHAPK